MSYTNIILFFLLSIPLIIFSWHPLKNPEHHGFYRFFAFECILIIIISNAPYWMGNLINPAQFLSGVFLTTSVLFVFLALFQLKRAGGKRASSTNPENYNFENTNNLVSSGIYKYIRHPMYSSLLFLTWGAFLKHFTWYGLVPALAASVFIYLAVKKEEKENISYFGEAYKNYIQKTKKFIPFIL